MRKFVSDKIIELDTSRSIWPEFFTIAPLVVIGTKEGDTYDLAPKHMVTPLGPDNFFGFVCTPKHSTYLNVVETCEFTVSFIKPSQVVFASLAASPRCGDDSNEKPIVSNLDTFHAQKVDALFIQDSYLFLECKLDRIVDGFGEYGMIAGRIIEAYVDQGSLRCSDRDEDQMIHNSPMLAYLAHSRFAEIKDTYLFPLPKDYKK